jgi:hypothetical protein
MSNIKYLTEFYNKEIIDNFFPLTLKFMSKRELKTFEKEFKHIIFNPRICGEMYVSKKYYKNISSYER